MQNKNKNKIIISLCHKKKYGLLDIANALTMYGNRHENFIDFYLLSNSINLFKLLTNSPNKIICCVVWDNSFFSLFNCFLLKLFSIKIIYYYHEPGGFRHKVNNLKNKFFSALGQSIAEFLFKLLSTYNAVSLKKNLHHGHFYLPILFSDIRPPRRKKNKTIGFMGFRKRERCPILFEKTVQILQKNGYQAIFFPSKEYGFLEHQKFDFLSRTDIVWNVFNCPNNISAVTGDAFMSKTPIIVSKYEKFIKLLRKHNLCVEIDIYDPPNFIAEKILSYLSMNNNPLPSISTDHSNFGGSKAYVKYWQPVFYQLTDKLNA